MGDGGIHEPTSVIGVEPTCVYCRELWPCGYEQLRAQLAACQEARDAFYLEVQEFGRLWDEAGAERDRALTDLKACQEARDSEAIRYSNLVERANAERDRALERAAHAEALHAEALSDMKYFRADIAECRKYMALEDQGDRAIAALAATAPPEGE